MKRVSAGWLISIVILLTALGTGGTTIPLRSCGSCHGLVLHQSQMTRLPPPQGWVRKLDCPDCADRGRVSLWRAWHPRVSEPIRQILQGLRSPATANLTPILKPLMRMEGIEPEDFSQFWLEEGWIGSPCFVRAEGALYLILLSGYWSSFLPGDSSAGAILLQPEGRVLDCVEMICSNRYAHLSPALLEKQGDDGARVIFKPMEGSFTKGMADELPYRLHQIRRKSSEGVTACAGKPESDGVCRLRIVGGRFEILVPAAK